MASMNTRLNIEKLNGNIVQKHEGSKQVGFKQLGHCVKTRVYGVHVQKFVWFEVELQGAQENREAEVIQESNDHVALAQRKLKVKQLKGKTNTDHLVNKQVHHGANVGGVIMKIGVPDQEGAEGNAAERYRGDINMDALGVAAVIEEYAHESLTFRDAVACEAEIWVTKGLLDEAKEIILGMEIFRTQSGNTLRVSRFRFSNGMSVQILLGGHSTMSLEEDTWLKGAESGFELRLVAGIATCALMKVVPSLRFLVQQGLGFSPSGNTRDLGSFGEETDKITNQHQDSLRFKVLEPRDGVTIYTRRRHTSSSDGVTTFLDGVSPYRLNSDLEDSTL
ncbi:hypothetical protein Tco_1320405 [Tanacetum coccineum]